MAGAELDHPKSVQASPEDPESSATSQAASYDLDIPARPVGINLAFQLDAASISSSVKITSSSSTTHPSLPSSFAVYAVFGSILNIGAMVGAVSSGRVANFFGRKGAMRISSIISLIGWLAIYLTQGSLSLYFGRLITGWGIGIFSYSVPVFIAEISPKHLRGGLTTANQLFICAGVSTSLIVGTFVTWNDSMPRSTRWPLLHSGIS